MLNDKGFLCTQNFQNGIVIIPKSEKVIEVIISANFGDVKDSKKILVSPYEEPFENKIIKSLNNIMN